MNTAEMYLAAQKDSMYYKAINYGNYDGTILYQKDKGLIDEENLPCPIETWNYFNDLMEEEWELYDMSKKEAEEKFHIKIID